MAQYFSIGTDPSSVHWEVIETSHFKVIFPKEYRNNAQEIVRNLEFLYPKIGKTLNMSPRKTTLIIHNRTIVSNGVTTLTPKRIELFTAQSPNGYAQPWMDQLILHEMRHICQMDKLNSASVRLLYYLFGDQIVGGVIGLYIPQWFLEGDAVLSETTLSNSGRGRTPIFTSELRSTLLHRGVDSYSKSMFGSYKEPVADQYQQGFYIVKTATEQYGSEFWAKNISKTAKNPFIPNPFRRSFKKQAGVSITKYYQQTMEQLKTSEQIRISNTSINEHHSLVSDTNCYANYESMSVVDDSTIIATKDELHKTTRIVIIKNGKQQVIEENSLIVKGSLTVENNIACWTERRYHPRWDQSSWFTLVTYNLTTKKRNVIIKNCRLHAPSLSHSANKIVAVEQNTTDTNSLNIYNIEGKLLQKIASPEQSTILQPRWCENDTAIVAILLNRSGKQLARYSFDEKKWVEISIPTHHNFLLWQIVGDTAIVTISQNNNTPVSKVSLTDGGCSIAVTLPFDVSSAMATPNGQIVCMQTTGLGIKPFLAVPTSTSVSLFTTQISDEYTSLNKLDAPLLFDSAPDTAYLVKPYRKINHLFNIHSWGPISVNSSSGTANPGFSLSSQNDLSTSIFEAGISYSTAEQSTTYYSRYFYDGWFTQLNASYETKMGGNDSEQSSYRQSEAKFGLRIPLVFERRNYYVPLTFNAIASSIEFSNFERYLGNINALHLRLYQGVIKRTPDQALLPPLGYLVELNFKTDMEGTLSAGSIASVEGTIYLPSFFKNHGFSLYGGVQHIDAKQYYYGTMLQYPRGFIGTVKSNAIMSFINYQFPLCYPDLSIGSILYLKRLRVALFHDYMKYEKPQILTQFRSIGAEIMADSYWFRFIAPVSLGTRITYVSFEKKVIPELIFGINFNNL